MKFDSKARERMREMAGAATPGPWEWAGDNLIWPSTSGPAAHDPIAHVSEAHVECAPFIAAARNVIPDLLDDLDDAEQRAERAEAELAALRERVRGLADNADMMAAANLSRDFTGKPFLPATVTTNDLRHLLDDDTTGAAAGEGEVADSCTYRASQIKQAQERRVKTEQECERLEDLRPKPGDDGYAGYAQMFNDITFAPIVTHLLFSDRGRMADALWAAGYRKTEGETK